MIEPAQLTDGGADASRERQTSFLIRSARQLTFVLLCSLPAQALADGGHIAFRAISGQYNVTLFTAPEPLVSGPVDLSLLVQDAVTDEVLGDATAAATLTQTGREPMHLSFTHAAASNKLLLAATPTLPRPGTYTLALRLDSPGAPTTSFTVQLLVAADHRRRTTLLFALVLPLAAILLFLANQQAKARRRPGASALH